VFRAKRADRVKIVAWDGSGLILFWKRLEQGAFKWPPVTDGVMRLRSAQLAVLVDGMDWSRLHRGKLHDRQRHRESCDLLNQDCCWASQMRANLIQISPCRPMLFPTILTPCGRW